MRRSSRKAWKLLHAVRHDHTKSKQHGNITPNQIAHQLVLNGKATKSKKQILPKIDRRIPLCELNCTRPFSNEELTAGF